MITFFVWLMRQSYKQITNSGELEKVLQRTIFPNLPFNSDLNLTEHWGMGTEHGDAYVKEHGLNIICKCLNVFRHKPLPRCKFAHRDMRSDILGMPMVEGWQIALLDQCCDSKTCSPEVIQTCVYNDILTRDCYDFLYDLIPEKPKLNNDVTVLDSEKSSASVSEKPGAKRRKKT